MRPTRARLVLTASLAVGLFLTLLLAPLAMAAPTYEPNDTFDTAYGPLVPGNTYSDTIATGDDVDDYYFYVTNPNGSQVQVTINDPTVGGDGVYAELDDSNGNWVDYVDVGNEDSATLDENLDPGKYYLSVQSETADQTDEAYSFSIAAGSGALGSYADVQSGCKAATAAVSTAQAALNQALKRLRQVHNSPSHHRKAQAHRAVKVARANLKAASAAMKTACSIPA